MDLCIDFPRKVTHSTSWLNFGINFDQNHPVFLKFFVNKFELNFGHILKSPSIHIPNGAFYKGLLIPRD